jgi:hypothetical protein
MTGLVCRLSRFVGRGHQERGCSVSTRVPLLRAIFRSLQSHLPDSEPFASHVSSDDEVTDSYVNPNHYFVAPPGAWG